MKIRELVIKDFRSFRGERRISFVDPATDKVRPVTVLAGSNGCGKTTVLDTIEAMIRFFQTMSFQSMPRLSVELLKEAQEEGSILLVMDVSQNDMVGEFDFSDGDQSISLLVGGKEDSRNPVDGFLQGRDRKVSPKLEVWQRKVAEVIGGFTSDREGIDLYGGVLHFPSRRYLVSGEMKPIAEPPREIEQEWFFRFQPKEEWRGSLEELWVWQNYLDLEAFQANRASNRANLTPFVESVEAVLSEDRRITIAKGRVRVPVGWHTPDGERPTVFIDQLPSGEQQVLLLFGELARRRRAQAIIMIDEVENSLHPTLQRLVMWNLERLAREWDEQIIVTTHSTEVINWVRGGAFINLDYPDNHFDQPVARDQEL